MELDFSLPTLIVAFAFRYHFALKNLVLLVYIAEFGILTDLPCGLCWFIASYDITLCFEPCQRRNQAICLWDFVYLLVIRLLHLNLSHAFVIDGSFILIVSYVRVHLVLDPWHHLISAVRAAIAWISTSTWLMHASESSSSRACARM